MAKTIENKTVVITGGADGIGFEIADSFLNNKANKVIILDINEELGREAAEKLTNKYGKKVDFLKCDVTRDLNEISKVIFDKYKKLDVLVNNAGILNEFDVKKTISINVTALIEWSFKFNEHMRTDKGGKGGTIVNMASIYGFRTDPYLPIYKASKYAVMGFTKTLGHEYNHNRFGVRVIAICPGFTETKLAMNLSELPDQKTLEDFSKFLKSPAALWQTVDAVGRAAIEIFQTADSGTAWVIEGDGPIKEVV